MSIDQSSILSKLNDGHAALWEHDWDGAVLAYNEALATAPENDSALSGMGLALFHQKRYSDSLRIFQELAHKNLTTPCQWSASPVFTSVKGFCQKPRTASTARENCN